MNEQQKAAALTIERIKQARETLTSAAFYPDFAGAIDAVDPQGTFLEAKRNLAALMRVIHGYNVWDTMLEER